jgi:hypothetical protein
MVVIVYKYTTILLYKNKGKFPSLFCVFRVEKFEKQQKEKE